MTIRIDLGRASRITKGIFLAVVQLESGKIIENNIRYRSKPWPPTSEPKIADPN